MSDEEFATFQINISRELGGIVERLRSIDDHLTDYKQSQDAMWRKIDKNSKDILEIKVKVAIIASALTLIVNYAPKALSLLLA